MKLEDIKKSEDAFMIGVWLVFTIGTTLAWGFGGFLIGATFPFLLQDIVGYKK